MRFLMASAMLFLGFVAPASAQTPYPANPIQWRPPDAGVAFATVWGYDADGNITCPSANGLSCISTRELAVARAAERTLSCGDQMRTHYGISGYDTEGHWCRELALRHGNREGFRWRAPAHGVDIYWRRNPATGGIECASGGASCFFGEPTLETAFRSTQVVACTTTDYQAPGHWCNALAGERRGNGYAWKPHQRMNYGRRHDEAIETWFFSYDEDGNIQCPSHDRFNCFWPKTREEAETATQPLACGAQQQAQHGYNGYDRPGHWCRVIALAEGNAAGFTYQWDAIGLVAGRGLPDVMCASANGVDCSTWAPLSVRFHDANPLVCGLDFANRFGGDGYDAGWCQQSAVPDMRGRYVRIQNRSGLPVKVCHPVWFDGSDQDARFTALRCSDLAPSGDGYATATAVTLRPLGTHPGTRTAHQAVCVETPHAAGLFLGPVAGIDGQVSIEPVAIRGGHTMIDLTAGVRTCRDAFATLSTL